MPTNAATGNEVDEWFAVENHPLEAELQHARRIILAVDSRITEAIKWKTPTFAFEGNICSFHGQAKKQVSLLFHRGAEIPGDHPRLLGDGKLSRMMRFADLVELEAEGQHLTDAIAAWVEAHDPDQR